MLPVDKDGLIFKCNEFGSVIVLFCDTLAGIILFWLSGIQI